LKVFFYFFIYLALSAWFTTLNGYNTDSK